MNTTITFEQLNELLISLIESQCAIESEIHQLKKDNMEHSVRSVKHSVNLRKTYLERIEKNLEVINKLMVEATSNPCEVVETPVIKS